MPPKKTTAPSKAPAKTTAAKPAAKPAAGKAPAKTTAPKGAAAAKPEAAPAKKEEEAPKPVVIAEVPFKQIDAKIVWDKEGTIKDSGKWALVMDENGLVPRFLRHRDVNMLTVPDNSDMEPEKIRVAIIGSLKWGKPLVLDMMEAEMYEFLVERFNQILPGLFEMILTKDIIKEENYMKLVKESDGQDFQNQYDYKMLNFSFIITTTCMSPNETLMRKTYPVKAIN